VSPQLTREYFTKELKKHYQGYNNTDVFTSTWNAIMNTVRAIDTWKTSASMLLFFLNVDQLFGLGAFIKRVFSR